MKTKSLKKKLNLKKERVAQLNSNELNIVKGGSTGSHNPPQNDSVYRCLSDNVV